jgi:flagellar biosynthetic protein FliR
MPTVPALPALPEVATAQLVGFFLVAARVGGIFVFAPVFSSRLIPARVKAFVAAAFALALTPLATRNQVVPSEALDIATLLVKELAVGLGFALAIGVIAAAIQMGASLLDTLIGFSFGSLLDPFTNVQGAVLMQVYGMVASVVFVLTGGDQLVVLGLARSYELIPLDAVPSLGALASLATDSLATISVIGLEIAAPVVIALVVTDVAFGIVSRVAPQMNVYFVGLPAKILLGLAIAGASLPFVAVHFENELRATVMRALEAFRP